MYINKDYNEAKKTDNKIKEVQKIESERWKINIKDV